MPSGEVEAVGLAGEGGEVAGLEEGFGRGLGSAQQHLDLLPKARKVGGAPEWCVLEVAQGARRQVVGDGHFAGGKMLGRLRLADPFRHPRVELAGDGHRKAKHAFEAAAGQRYGLRPHRELIGGCREVDHGLRHQNGQVGKREERLRHAELGNLKLRAPQDVLEPRGLIALRVEQHKARLRKARPDRRQPFIAAGQLGLC